MISRTSLASEKEVTVVLESLMSDRIPKHLRPRAIKYILIFSCMKESSRAHTKNREK